MIAPFFIINTNTLLFLLIVTLFFYLPGCSSETDDLSMHDNIIYVHASTDENENSEAQNWNNIGHIWHSKGQYDKAIEFYEKALNSNVKTYGKRHTSVGVGWIDLGTVWQKKGDYDKAIKFYEKALEILEKDNINYQSVNDSLKTAKEMRNSRSKKKGN